MSESLATKELTGEEVAELHREYVMQSWHKQGEPVMPVKYAKGIYVYDYGGNKYADMSSLLVCSDRKSVV